MPTPYIELMLRLRERAQLSSAYYLLGWDQETGMPPRAAGPRAEQLALIARLAHERGTDDRIGELLDACERDGGLDDESSANLREIRRDYDRARRLPADLVAEMSETSSRALQIWKQARERSDFSAFAPMLEKQLDLCRQKAERLGTPPGGEPYDALLDEYAPGMTAARVEAIFGPLRERLAPLIAEIARAADDDDDGGARPSRRVQSLKFPIERQRALNRHVSERLGFAFDAGRMATSVHPFSTGIAPFDTGITTRYTGDNFAEALGSTVHEVGHGLYEQGLPKDRYWGQPLSEAVGLGIHESQSRLWENHVFRSLPFWRWCLPVAREMLGGMPDDLTVEEVHRAVNTVRAQPIRVEADEATYNLHVMIRFDLERALFRGELAVRDLPEAWNARMKDDLGVEVEDDARGCLQDIHWSMGSIGYFPTYTLGSLYAAQFWDRLTEEVDGVDAAMERGDFAPVLGWLREKVHALGRRLSPHDLCVAISGRPLEHGPLMDHLHRRFGALYGLDAR